MGQVTTNRKRILSFFRRTQGLQTFGQVVDLALAVYPDLDADSAADKLWVDGLNRESEEAEAGVGCSATPEELASLDSLVAKQYGRD